MKTYLELNEELTKEELFEGLLAHGLFADKIPNFLTSEPFFQYIKSEGSFPYNIPDNGQKASAKPTEYIRYLNMRNINVPRALSIPEPFSYANQTYIIHHYWDKILRHFKNKTKNQTYKVSRIHIRKLVNNQAIFKMNYNNFESDGSPEEHMLIKNRYVAHADISTCFPSMYSHSIAWALLGKNQAKQKSSKKFKNNWANQIDFYTRNLKFGETNGLLIGPHSSNLISEIILNCIDYELVKKKYQFYRNIDDYTCYTDSKEKAEYFFIELSNLLKDFELSINSKKNKISQLPQASVVDWVSRLNNFYFKDTYLIEKDNVVGIKLIELRNFIDLSINLMLEHENSAVLSYMIKVISSKYLGDNATSYYINKIHHLTLLYPYLVLF